MKKVLLPFEYHPYSLIYQENAFLLGIIQGNATEDITPWLCGKYINCCFDPILPNIFEYNVLDGCCTEDNILIDQRMCLYPEQSEFLLGMNILDIFKSMLDMGFYPHGNYNEEYIPGKWSYGEGYYVHDFVLVGYDDSLKSFISAGYLSDGKFQKYLIPYKNMDRAIATSQIPKLNYRFWKYNPNATYELNMQRIIQQLDDYIRSTTTMKVYTDDKTWGMQALLELSKHFESCSAQKKPLDIRYTRGIMEYKFFMKMTIEYLLKKGYLSDTEVLDHAERVSKMSQLVHMLGLKYNMTGKESIVHNICDTVKKIIETEMEYLPSVLMSLRSKYGGGIT